MISFVIATSKYITTLVFCAASLLFICYSSFIHFISINLFSYIIPCHGRIADFQFHCLPISYKSNLRMSIGYQQPLVYSFVQTFVFDTQLLNCPRRCFAEHSKTDCWSFGPSSEWIRFTKGLTSKRPFSNLLRWLIYLIDLVVANWLQHTVSFENPPLFFRRR